MSYTAHASRMQALGRREIITNQPTWKALLLYSLSWNFWTRSLGSLLPSAWIKSFVRHSRLSKSMYVCYFNLITLHQICKYECINSAHGAASTFRKKNQLHEIGDQPSIIKPRFRRLSPTYIGKTPYSHTEHTHFISCIKREIRFAFYQPPWYIRQIQINNAYSQDHIFTVHYNQDGHQAWKTKQNKETGLRQ